MASNIHIEDSYKISKFKFKSELANYESLEEKDVKKHRSLFSLKMEWTVHNFLYRIGIQRKRTKDVDLDYPCDKPEFIYIVLGILFWLFIP